MNPKFGSHKCMGLLNSIVDKIVVNLSSFTFTDTEVHLLRRGLAFSIAPPQLDGIDIQTSFECFYRQLVSNLPSGSVTRLKQRLKNLRYNYIYGYRNKQHQNLSKEELLAFRNLKRRKDIVFCKSD